MQEAKRRIPHFSYVEEIDVTDLETTRAALNARYGATRGKLTVLPLLARALVIAVRDFPQMNARYDDGAGSAGGAARVGGTGAGAGDSGAGDSGGGGGGGGGGVVTRYAPVHLGIATQTDNGLMVPVVRHAEARDPWSCAAEIARLSEAARSGRGTREELSGSTITITSLGPLGGIVTTPVINHPEVAIVGVNKIVERPVVRDNTVVVRKLMNLSSSFDHRVVDGMDAAAFVQAIRRLLESPALLFVD
jgi:2-oxoisovalerate dehydrogenase E2 component (dihydrolipoyl transacylase)